MNRFVVLLNDGSHMNVPADRMELKEISCLPGEARS